MEQEKYEALLTAVKSGSLSGGAESLGYTPSGMSRIIAALEKECGFSLLERSKEGVTPTAECGALIPAIKEWIRYGNVLRQKAAEIRGAETGTVRIGIAYNAFYKTLAEYSALFRKDHPNIQIEIRNGYSSRLAEALRLHELDFVLISQRDVPCEWLTLREDELVVVAPMNGVCGSLKSFPASMFSKVPYIETYPGTDSDNARYFRKKHVIPNVQFTTTDSFASCSMVNAGLGITLNNHLNVSEWTGQHRIIPLKPAEKIKIGLAVSSQLSPCAKKYKDFLIPLMTQK